MLLLFSPNSISSKQAEPELQIQEFGSSFSSSRSGDYLWIFRNNISKHAAFLKGQM